MAEYTAVALQTVAAGADVAFTETAVNEVVVSLTERDPEL